MTFPLYDLTAAVRDLAELRRLPAGPVVVNVPLEKVKVSLDCAYGETEPGTGTVLEAAARMFVELARRLPLAWRQQVPVLLTAQFAAHHGVELSLGPVSMAVALTERVAEGRLDAAEVLRWLRSKSLGDAALVPVDRTRLLQGLFTAGSMATTASSQDLRMSGETMSLLKVGLRLHGADVVCPSPRRLTASPGGPRIDDVGVALLAAARQRQSVATVVPPGQLSAGTVVEVGAALSLDNDVLLLQDKPTVAPWMNDPKLHRLPGNHTPQLAADSALQWHRLNAWRLVNNERNRRDRAVLLAGRLHALRTAWSALSAYEQTQVAARRRTTVAAVKACLATETGLAVMGLEQVARLEALLDVDPPQVRLPAREFYDSEINALEAVLHERDLHVVDALAAAMDLLGQLNAPGASRYKMTADAWREYLDGVGLS